MKNTKKVGELKSMPPPRPCARACGGARLPSDRALVAQSQYRKDRLRHQLMTKRVRVGIARHGPELLCRTALQRRQQIDVDVAFLIGDPPHCVVDKAKIVIHEIV